MCQQYPNSPSIVSKSSSILYMTFHNIDLEIVTLFDLFVAFYNDFLRGTSVYRVLKFFAGLSRYARGVLVLKLVLETEYLRCLLLELFLLMLFWASSIQLNLFERFCEKKSLILLWQSSSIWFEYLIKV